MLQITVAGRIGKDAETRQAGQTSVTNFSVAVDTGYGDKKKTVWLDCSLFGQRGEKLAQYLTKGQQVTVTGEGGLRTWDSNGKSGAAMTLRVHEIALQGGGSRSESSASPSSVNDDDLDMPF